MSVPLVQFIHSITEGTFLVGNYVTTVKKISFCGQNSGLMQQRTFSVTVNTAKHFIRSVVLLGTCAPLHIEVCMILYLNETLAQANSQHI